MPFGRGQQQPRQCERHTPTATALRAAATCCVTRAARGDLEWKPTDGLKLSTGVSWKKFSFATEVFDRNNDLLNPTLREAGVTTASVAASRAANVP